ncbi:sugar transferase, partial [Campylobacter jejuni]
MYNPNSAIERVKNHLAYKLGQTAIEHRHNCGGGYIALFKKLYKIKKQHKKEQKIYQQTIQVFPQLKYPSLEACSDYEQALKYKFHLSYMLGEVLIKAYQTWYKGSGFKLKNDIKKAKKEFQIFREIFKEFDQINSSILKGLIDNKQLFLKEFSRIKNILKIHQDYKAILDNIFHNFNYFIQNFDLIEEWLLSDDFKERYKKENHPYPSLLDPKKLNDKNEKINYKNIPAELAWEMNLLLPRNYRFIFITGGSCGHMAMFLYFKLLKINRNWTSETEKEKYKIAYNVFIASKEYNIFSCQWIQMTRKLFYLADAEVPLIVLLRDPIERLKSSTNHIVKHSTQFDLTLNPNEVLANKYYKMKDYPSLEKVDTIVDYPNYFDIFSKIT